MDSFLFVTKDIEIVSFEETAEKKGALIKVTALELNKVSQNTPATEYRIEEGEEIASSLVGVPVYYGTNWMGKHDRTRLPIGKVESTQVQGNQIKAWVRITSKDIIERLKKGLKFLFSVGGNASFSEVVRKAGKVVHRMIGAICSHLQMVDIGTKVGFPNAKINTLVEINETVMILNYDKDPVDNAIETGIENAIGLIFARRYV